MIVKTLSPSKLERIRLCEARVQAQLFDESYEEEQGEPARTGTLAHHASMLWYRPAPGGGYTYTDLDLCFKDAMTACSHKEFKRGDEVIVESELPQDPSSIQQARTFFDQIVAHYKRDAIKVVFAERRYRGALKNGVPVHLIVDLGLERIETLPGGAQVKVLEIVDYKTGFLEKTLEEMYDADQVLMNLLAVRADAEFKEYQSVRFTYFWVRKGFVTGPVSLSDERLADYEHWLALEYQRILDIKEPSESLNRFCGSCGRKYECTKYRKFLSEAMSTDTTMTPEQLSRLDDDAVMAMYEKLKGQSDRLLDLRSALGDHIKGQMAIRQVQQLEGKDYKAAIRSAKNDAFSVQAVMAMCLTYQVDPSSVMSVKKSAVEAKFADKPEAMSQLNLTMKRGQNAPSLAISQTGVKKRVTPRKKKDEIQHPEMPLQPISAPPTPVNPIQAELNF